MPVSCRTGWRSDHRDAPVPGCPVSTTPFLIFMSLITLAELQQAMKHVVVLFCGENTVLRRAVGIKGQRGTPSESVPSSNT